VKTCSTQRKNSVVARASHSAGRSDCRAWAGGIAALLHGKSNDESQRDSGSKPKVARHELPWVSAALVNNPNGVVARWENRGATPLGLKTFAATTQGSSRLATLGWRTQSLWDCSSEAILVRAGFLCDGYVIVSRKLVKTPEKSGKSYMIPKPGILNFENLN